jgi:hypothetical protein
MRIFAGSSAVVWTGPLRLEPTPRLCLCSRANRRRGSAILRTLCNFERLTSALSSHFFASSYPIFLRPDEVSGMPPHATLDCFSMTTNRTLSDTGFAARTNSRFGRRTGIPASPCRTGTMPGHQSLVTAHWFFNRHTPELEIDVPHSKQRTADNSNRHKAGGCFPPRQVKGCRHYARRILHALKTDKA